MKTNTSNPQLLSGYNKRDLAVFVTGSVILSLSTYILCRVMNLSHVVLLTASIVSILDAIYYGFVWKALKKSVRIGLAIFFIVLSAISFLLYRVFIQGDITNQSNLAVAAQLLGMFAFAVTFVFIYKHKTLKFWQWF